MFAGIEEYLETTAERFDSVFLDTWDTLEPKQLPRVNSLRDKAAGQVRRGGSVLLWGYRWMVDLYADACVRLLSNKPSDRTEILDRMADDDPESAAILGRIARYYARRSVVEAPEATAAAHSIATRITDDPPGRE